MNIPDEAVELAARALMALVSAYKGPADEDWHEEARAALTAAGPLIAAQTLRDAASEFPRRGTYYDAPRTWLLDRADALGGGTYDLSPGAFMEVTEDTGTGDDHAE